MTYTLYYVHPVKGGFQVRSEQYETINAPDPIEGTDAYVSTHASRAIADTKARALQRRSFATSKTGTL